MRYVDGMRPSDVPQAAALAARTGLTTWTEGALREELTRDVARACVVREGETVVAFALWWQVDPEQELLAIATEPAHRRRGHARALLQELLAEGALSNVEACFLDVRAGNASAIALYRAMGFVDHDVRRRYYDDGEDALLMIRRR